MDESGVSDTIAATPTAWFIEFNKRIGNLFYKRGGSTMKRANSVTAIISLLMFASIASYAQTTDSNNTSNTNASNLQASNLSVTVNQLVAEVKTLKTEVLKLKLELQQSKVERLERELHELQASKRKTEDRENEFKRELATVEERLSKPIYDNEERVELENARVKLMEKEQLRPRTAQQEVSQQETELSQRLAREQETWQEMVEKARKLGIEVSENLATRDRSSRSASKREH